MPRRPRPPNPDTPRGRCPGCGRDDVILLPPRGPRATDRRGTGRHAARPWRRKAHAIAGSIHEPNAIRCRYPADLQPDEIPTTARTPCDA